MLLQERKSLRTGHVPWNLVKLVHAAAPLGGLGTEPGDDLGTSLNTVHEAIYDAKRYAVTVLKARVLVAVVAT